MLKKFLSAVCTLVCVGAFAAADVRIPFAVEPPALDGKGASNVWKEADWSEGFTKLSAYPEKPQCQTRFKMLHDNEFVYLFIEAFDDRIDQMKVTFDPAKEDYVYYGECVELILDINQSKERFYHFIVNPDGQFYDAELIQGGFVRRDDWHCSNLKIASSKNEKSWMLEMAIPMADLGIENNSRVGLINIARNHHGAIEEQSSYAPANSTYFELHNFPNARFQHGDFARYLWQICPPYETIVAMKEGKLTYSGKVQLTNATEKDASVQLKLSLDNESVTFPVTLKYKESKEFSFALPATAGDKAQTFAMQVLSADGSKVFLKRQEYVTVTFSPIVVTLSEPAYRDTIFSDMKLDAISGSVQYFGEKDEAKQFEAELLDKAGEKIGTCTVTQAGTFSLPLPAELQIGEYSLVVRCGNDMAKKLIRKLPHLDGEVRFDARQTAYVNGKEFIPFGAFSVTDRPEAAGQGLNVAVLYESSWYSDKEMLEVLDDYHKNGFKAMIFPYDTVTQNRYNMRVPLTPEEENKIRLRVRAIKNHPALLGWYLGDELESVPAIPSRVRRVHEICRDEDPYHPTMLLDNTTNGCYMYRGCSDITCPDPYPAFVADGKAAHDIIMIYTFLKAVRAMDNWILWYTPEFFNWGDCGRTGERAPTYQELRCMHYQALIAGVSGVVSYTYCDCYAYPEMRMGKTLIGKEMRALKDIVLNQNVRQELETGTPKVLAARWAVDGKEYLAVVNCNVEAAPFTIPAAGKKYFAAGETLSFEPKDGKLSGTLESYQARVFVSDETLAHSFALADHGAMVQAEIRRLHKPGNLLYRNSAVKFTPSTNDKFTKLEAWHLNDGHAFRARNGVHSENDASDGAISVEFEFPEAVTAGRFAVYGLLTGSVQLEAEVNGSWQPCGDAVKLAVDDGYANGEGTFQSVTARKFRVTATGRVLAEIELYKD